MNNLVHVAAHRVDYGTDDQIILETDTDIIVVSHCRYGWTVEDSGDFPLLFDRMDEALDYACSIHRH